MDPCQSLLLPPQAQVCSGHGVCFNDTVLNLPRCNCSYPWTSRGDFRYEENLDCDVFPPAITAIYCLSAIGFFVCFVLCLKNLSWYWTHTQQGLKDSFRGPMLIHQLVLLTAALHLIFDILKIVDPVYYSIGLEPVSTWVMGFANIFLFSFGWAMTRGVLIVSLKQCEFTGRSSTKLLLFTIQKITPIMFVGLSGGHLLSTVGGLYSPQNGFAFLFATVIGSNVLFIGYAFFVPIALGHILQDMGNLISQAKQSETVVSPNLVDVFTKFKRLRVQFFTQPIQNGIINLIIAFWPFLLRK
jgi:hypothetical protein